MRLCLLSLVFLSSLTAFSSTEPVRTKHVTAELLLENRTLQPGAKGPAENLVGLRLETIPHWHTYWRFPGDSGLPTEVVWHLPPGWSAEPLQWALPSRIFVPPLVNYGYEGETLLAARLNIPAGFPEGEQVISVAVSWLVCKEECVPEKAELGLKVQVAKGKPEPATFAVLFERLRAQQPQPLPAGFRANIIYKGSLIGIEFSGLPGLPGLEQDFFPLAPMLVKGDAPPKVAAGRATTLWLEKADPFNEAAAELPGVLYFKDGGKPRVFEFTVPLPSREVAPPADASLRKEIPRSETGTRLSNWLMILFAFFGGLILNLMPCVFPVLGIKVLSLVRKAGADRAHVRQHGKAYALGVLVCFWMLAGVLVLLRSLGEAVGWGFQLQQPLFVTLLILLFSFVTADLAGFIRWSGRWMGAGSNLAGKAGYSGSFFTGMLAVVVATPCTAPFMGTAIGAAIGEAGWVVFLVFTSLGMGLALPFVLLCYKPGYVDALPKPGAWMERLKELLAIPMAASVLWLLWVLTQQIGADGALKVELGLLVLMVSVWARNRFASEAMRMFGYALLLLGLLIAGIGSIAKPALDASWAPYSEAALSRALDAGKPVFVDFTAAWCLTCQINKKLVLDRAGTQEFFREKGIVLLMGDWTNRDPEITRALERQDRIGVPVYLTYRAGSHQPEVLPQILTEERIRAAFP